MHGGEALTTHPQNNINPREALSGGIIEYADCISAEE